jgi:hypothetical protein
LALTGLAFLATGAGFLAGAFLGDFGRGFFHRLRVTFFEAGGVALLVTGAAGALAVVSVEFVVD